MAHGEIQEFPVIGSRNTILQGRGVNFEVNVRSRWKREFPLKPLNRCGGKSAALLQMPNWSEALRVIQEKPCSRSNAHWSPRYLSYRYYTSVTTWQDIEYALTDPKSELLIVLSVIQNPEIFSYRFRTVIISQLWNLNSNQNLIFVFKVPKLHVCYFMYSEVFSLVI